MFHFKKCKALDLVNFYYIFSVSIRIQKCHLHSLQCDIIFINNMALLWMRKVLEFLILFVAFSTIFFFLVWFLILYMDVKKSIWKKCLYKFLSCPGIELGRPYGDDPRYGFQGGKRKCKVTWKCSHCQEPKQQLIWWRLDQ